MQPTPVFLPEKWTEDPGGIQSRGSQRVRYDWATDTEFHSGEWDRLGDLGTFAKMLAPGHTSPPNSKIQRNYTGLKLTACMHSWGKLWTKDTERPKKKKKKKNPNATFEEPGAKTGCQEQKQGTEHALCPQHLSPLGKSPKPPLQPNLWTHPYPHPK